MLFLTEDSNIKEFHKARYKQLEFFWFDNFHRKNFTGC